MRLLIKDWRMTQFLVSFPQYVFVAVAVRRYFHYELQCTVREMEGGIYEKMSHYLGTLAR